MPRRSYPEHAGRWIVTLRRVSDDGDLDGTVLATTDPAAVRAVLEIVRARTGADTPAAEVEPCAGS